MTIEILFSTALKQIFKHYWRANFDWFEFYANEDYTESLTFNDMINLNRLTISNVTFTELNLELFSSLLALRINQSFIAEAVLPSDFFEHSYSIIKNGYFLV